MTTSSASSATPILDLLVPLPKPQGERFALRECLIPAFLIATVLISRNYLLLIPIFGFWVVALLTIAVHELGHVVAGCSVGFRLQSVRIGPVRVKRASGKWTIELGRGLISGEASMSLDRICRVRKRLIILTAGGPATGLLVGAAALLGLRFAINRGDAFLSLVLLCFGSYSIFINFGNVLPGRIGRRASDGMRLKVLLCSREGTRQMLALRALEMQRRDGIDPFCMNSRWIRLASSQGNVITDPRYAAYVADWNAYQSAPSEVAAQLLEKCLANSRVLSTKDRDVLVAEAAVFTAWRRSDGKSADVWFKRVVNPELLHPLTRLRVEVALACAHRRFDHALEHLERGLEIIRGFPASTMGRKQESAWLEWRRKIETLREPQPVPATT